MAVENQGDYHKSNYLSTLYSVPFQPRINFQYHVPGYYVFDTITEDYLALSFIFRKRAIFIS